jgi:hypothetical protein
MTTVAVVPLVATALLMVGALHGGNSRRLDEAQN